MDFNIGQWVVNWAAKDKIKCEFSEVTTSTNDIAKSYNFISDEPIVFVTNSQTQGRGRGKNTWLNKTPGSYLLSTWSFHLDKAPQPITTPLAGLAVYWAITAAFQIDDLNIKAPNDIYIGDKKVGGLLVEVVSEGNHHRLNIGFGLNVFEKPNLTTAIDLQSHCRQQIIEEVFSGFLENLFIGFRQVINDCHEIIIAEAARNELLEALNKNPLLDSKYTSIEPDGSLQTQNQVIAWNSL